MDWSNELLSDSKPIAIFDGYNIDINKDIQLNKYKNYVKKQLLLDKKIILVHLASISNMNLIQATGSSINLLDLDGDINLVYKIDTNIIDDISLNKDYIILLKNQTNNNENGIYLYNYVNKILIKQLGDIENKYIFIIEGKVNKNTYWKINVENGKLNKTNLFLTTKLNPIDLNYFHKINLFNPTTFKCLSHNNNDKQLCTTKYPCNYNNIQGCLLLSNKIPINIHLASIKNLKLNKKNIPLPVDLSSKNFNLIYELNTNNIDNILLESNQYILLKNQKNLLKWYIKPSVVVR